MDSVTSKQENKQKQKNIIKVTKNKWFNGKQNQTKETKRKRAQETIANTEDK